MYTKKKIFRNTLRIIGTCLLLVVCKFIVYGNIPNHRSNMDLLQTVPSPDGTRTVSVYRYNGSATVCYAVLCKVNGQGVIDRPIYWLYHSEEASATWIDSDTVRINAIPYDEECVFEKEESIFLDIRSEWYDFRKGIGGFGRDENGKVFLHKWWKAN